jgi:hypothetical protein
MEQNTILKPTELKENQAVKVSPSRRIAIALIVLVMLKTIFGAAYFIALTENSAAQGGLSLYDTPQAWVRVLGGRDAGSYLDAALNWADHGNLELYCTGCTPPQMTPFIFWAPGTPLSMGIIFKIFGAENMVPIFGMISVFDVLISVGSLLTLSLLTTSWISLTIGTVTAALNIPLANYFYGTNVLWLSDRSTPMITTSEPLALVFTVFSFYFGALAMRQLWTKKHSFSLPEYAFFAASGLCIGLASLVRDSSSQFAYFLAAFLLLSVATVMRARWKEAVLGSFLIIACMMAIRLPVKAWNRRRTGDFIIASSSEVAIWRYGLWGDYSNLDPGIKQWVDDVGLGLGSYLEPGTAAEIRKRFERNDADSFSVAKISFMKAVLRHPIETISFRAKRMPALWFGKNEPPQVKALFIFCLFLYFFLFLHVIRSLLNRERPFEMFYLYSLFLLMASIAIHSEFRYTFPCLLTVQMIPAYEIYRLLDIYRRRSLS